MAWSWSVIFLSFTLVISRDDQLNINQSQVIFNLSTYLCSLSAVLVQNWFHQAADSTRQLDLPCVSACTWLLCFPCPVFSFKAENSFSETISAELFGLEKCGFYENHNTSRNAIDFEIPISGKKSSWTCCSFLILVFLGIFFKMKQRLCQALHKIESVNNFHHSFRRNQSTCRWKNYQTSQVDVRDKLR